MNISIATMHTKRFAGRAANLFVLLNGQSLKNIIMLRIAVQSKGRLYEDTMALLAEADIKVRKSERSLLVRANDFPIEILYLRDDDIPQTVASGVADLGIVGENEFLERGEDADVVKRLGFSKCRLSLAIPKQEQYAGPQWFNGKTIATSYPNILRKFLDDNNITANIHVITGSVEIAPGISLADAIFDIVSSGSTLITNNLKEVETVVKSEALLIATPGLGEDKKAVLSDLLFRLHAVMEANQRKYVMMNVPADRVSDIIGVLPGIKSPTVMPLADKAWCSVHTVLEKKSFWNIIGQLKEKGAQGILVLPIEKMVL